MVEGLIKMMNSKEIGPKNLGNPNERTILEVAEKIKNLTKSKSELTFLPLPEDDPTIRQPDISKARQFLSWEPEIKLEEGLKRTITWFKKNGNSV